MAKPDGLRRINTADTPKTPGARTPQTFEKLLLGGDASRWPSFSSPTLGRSHDPEEYYPTSQNKKSVLTKVKEKAKKLRYSLSKKKQGHKDDNESPSWGVTLDDDEDDDDENNNEDPEYLGAPMYESELAPETYKETARQHPRALLVVSEKHVLTSSDKNEGDQLEKDNPLSPNKTITQTVSEKLAPAAYADVSDAAHTIASKIAGPTGECGGAGSGMQKPERDLETREHLTGSHQKWDKGVSVKEYFMNKLEPGEDERVLSQVITKAISPRKAPGDMGVVEKVREAVTSLLHNQESSHSTITSTYLSSSSVPISPNAQPGRKH